MPRICLESCYFLKGRVIRVQKLLGKLKKTPSFINNTKEPVIVIKGCCYFVKSHVL